MVVQGATYARSMFHAQRNRRFVLMIFYNHRLGRVSFGLFTPAWLCLSTNHHDLHNEGGQRGFIQDMAQIWSCKDRWSAGFEDSCNNVQCYLERFGTFSYGGNICYRTSLRGRRTRVDLIINGEIWTDKRPVQNEYVMRPVQHQNEYYLSAEPQSGPLRFSARLAEKRLALSKGQGVNSPSELPIPFIKPDPKYTTLILKDSWPLHSRETREAEVFEISENNDNNKGKGDESDEHENEEHQEFGIPIILGCFSVTNSKGEVSDTASIFPEGEISFPTIWNDDGPELSSNLQTVESKPKSKQSSNPPITVELNEPEERVHVRLLISTQGVPLEHARGPRQLLQAVLHAMIGYSVIFRRRWLHRDVSIGNVLLMKTPKKRKRIVGFENILTNDILEKYFKEYAGFITDGDLAVNWNIPDRERAKQRSGTPPFMSCELLRSMNQEAFHSAIDDLESFVWVLFWAILSVMQLREAKFSQDEERYWTSLKSRDLFTLRTKREFPDTLFKQQIALSEQEEQEPGDLPVENAPSPAFAPFVGIIRNWLLLAFSDEMLLSKHRLQRVSVAQHERIVQEWIGHVEAIGKADSEYQETQLQSQSYFPNSVTFEDNSEESKSLRGNKSDYKSLGKTVLYHNTTTISFLRMDDKTYAINESLEGSTMLSEGSSVSRFPTFNFSLDGIAGLSSVVSTARQKQRFMKMNLLVGILEVDGPMYVTSKLKGNSEEMGLLKLIIGDDGGQVCRIVVWRETAELWGGLLPDGAALRRGDIVYFENIALTNTSVQKDSPLIQLVASPNHKSTAQICYRINGSTKEDMAFKPDLRLAQSIPCVRRVGEMVAWMQSTVYT
ncbi:hypothetical protein Clacol_010135 [Clathrus columnatus]|uniref:Fungal-type protein kinase domain-containing protein n=1 Tax=Clathrus columnatus TaxID=1419009 RepID=A0AAV5AME6_9AGAM|nr:hypothetical protein Clacol_010135 [Clathrus columnatus]